MQKPIYRTTPFGRECGYLLAVTDHTMSDYIPCICWGKMLDFRRFSSSNNIKIWGRIQSRDYQKKLENGEAHKTAFEVSVTKLEVISSVNKKEQEGDESDEYNENEQNNEQENVDNGENIQD